MADKKEHYVITDLGQEEVLTGEDGSKIVVGRYGVWNTNSGECVKAGGDLAALQKAYGLEGEEPILIGKSQRKALG